MKENIAELSARNVHNVQSINRALIEKALQMRCVSYLAQVKVKLLKETIYEIDSSKKDLQQYTNQLSEHQAVILRQKQELENKNRELLEMRNWLDQVVKQKSIQIEDASDELKESEERYGALFKHSHAVLLLVDPESGTIIDANLKAVSYYGWSYEELVGKNIGELNQLHNSLVAEAMERATTPEANHFLFKHKLASGEIRDVEVYSSPVKFSGKDVLFSIVHDITDRVAAQKAVWESEETSRALLNAITESAFLTDPEGEFFAANHVTAKRLGFETAEDLLGKNCYDLLPPELATSRKKVSDQVVETAESVRWQDQRQGRYIDARLEPVLNEEGEVYRVAFFARDITVEKEAQLKIEASLREKEVLLREIHHRVKNNLASIISLLNLQVKKVDDKDTIAALSDSRDRVRSMSLIHETLFRSENLAEIKVKDYVSTLGTRLLQAMNTSGKQIRMKYDVEDIRLEFDQAIPFGLILNELLTNALKYAFPEKGGVILVAVQRDGDDLELVVHDNGVGVVNLNMEELESLGLTIVSNLVENQLEGWMECKNDNGACFVIRWPRETV